MIIEEVSLISLEDLNEISERFIAAKLSTIPSHERELREAIRREPFGGIHVLFVGDLYQLPCVAGSPLYKPESQIPSDINNKTRKGFAIWKNFNSNIGNPLIKPFGSSIY